MDEGDGTPPYRQFGIILGRGRGLIKGVGDPKEREPVGRGRRPRAGPVPPWEEIPNPLGGAPSPSHFHQAPDDVPDHMVEKTVGRKEESDQSPP